MRAARLRLHGGLDSLLPSRRRTALVEQSVAEHATLKHLVESLGIPHTEIGRMMVDGAEVPLDSPADAFAQAGAIIEVHPARPEPVPAEADPPRFLADTHLGALARRLRLLGFDTRIAGPGPDAGIAACAEREDRIVLSRDRGLLMHRRIRRGRLIRAGRTDAQLREVVLRFGLRGAMRPFTRCLECNAPLQAIDREAVFADLPPRVRSRQSTFTRCTGCGRVYWPGTHWERLRAFVAALDDTAG